MTLHNRPMNSRRNAAISILKTLEEMEVKENWPTNDQFDELDKRVWEYIDAEMDYRKRHRQGED